MASVEDEPASGFAIVGYAARFPGAADADEFWDVLRHGRDAISEVPQDRWDVDEFFDPEPGAPGKVVTRRAGFVDDVAGFDAPFFNMSTREVRLMDPQHRILLETAWRAVEHSGTAPTALANSNTGVFVGLATHDYLGMASDELTYPEIEAYMAIGTSNAAAAGRISYRLGLQGPAVAVDTACSSSLVAIHQACQALRLKECDLALAGGANVLLTPATMITFSSAHMLAPDGRCKTFDAAADGYVRGEGCGVIVIKRLHDAIRDGDRIRAVIRGSAINQDGASGGLTVPNGVAQQRVIAEALKRADLEPRDVGYLEAHGTGTSLGDPIEAQAAGAALGAGREASQPLLMGSVKTNIGHLEAAAGIAGVIKVILALENELLPRHLHFENPSPHIPWDRLAVQVVDEATAWERNGRPRIAGISSFGFAGTNAHVILSEAPVPAAAPLAAPVPVEQPGDRRFSLLPLSARTPAALVRLAGEYRDWLSAHPEATLADVCFTAGTGRAHLEHRAALVVNSRESAMELLGALADDRPAPGLFRGESHDTPKTAWLFTGQGSQYPGMARELFDTEPVFAETLNRCAAAVASILEKPLLEVVFDIDGPDSEAMLRQTRYAQPALFAVEMGLARLWQSWGFEPDIVLGHSVGQYSAACVAGVVGLEDGAVLMAERGRLFASLPAGGRMVAVFTAAGRVENLTNDFPRLSVAAYNGANTVLSGPAGDLERAVAGLAADGVRCDWLDTSHAFHSALLDPILDDFESFADRFNYAAPQRVLIDNRTGAALGRSVRLDGAYWRRHARQPVQFAKSVHTLAGLNCKVLLEVGPRPVLTAAALSCWPDPATVPRAIASLRRNTADHRQITEAVAEAYVVGHLPEFAAFRRAHTGKLDLPTYPFEHRQYWFRDDRDRPDPRQQPGGPRTEAVRLLEEGRIEELVALLDADCDDPQTVRVLAKLAAQHNQERTTRSIADDRYEIRWKKAAAAPSGVGAGEGASWLLIGEDCPALAPLVNELIQRGQQHRFLGLPTSDADEEQLADTLRAAAAQDLPLRIVSVAAVDADLGFKTAPSMQSLLRMQHRILGGTRRLFRAAAAADLRTPVWLVTRGAQRVTDGDTVAPEQSSLWGFGRAVSLEHPQLWGGLADLAEGTADEWARFIGWVSVSHDAVSHDSASREDQVALRDQAVYVPRLVRREGQPSGTPLEIRPEATYLVTGGLGSIGLEIAGYLATHGAKHLVLTSRRSPGEDVQKRIDALAAQHGCEIQAIAADVADAHDVTRLLAGVQPPLAGIVHAAGEIGTTPLSNLDDAEVDRVFAGKVWGAWHLSEAAADLGLDFFLSTSSIASVWGGYGQSAYGAANAFLDGLAWRLRERGVRGTSVNFGPWSAGMADAQSRARLDQRGIRTLSPADALAGLADAAASSSAQGVVARIDWARFLPLYEQAGRRAFLTELEREVPDAVPPVTPSGTTQLVEQLTNAPLQQRKRLLTDYLRDAVAEVTRVDVAEIREDAGFFDLGMDSLMAVELRRRIENTVGREIPITLVMDHPRLSDVADYLLGDVLELSAQAAASQPAATVTARTDEPIAIVAVSCRFPGAPDPDAFWELLSGGVDAIREVPEDRFDIDEFYDPDPETPGKTYTRFGGFLDEIDGFDPEFFGISPREAVWIEPQQRLMLETVWEGLERAGYSPGALRGSRTGIFAGVAANEYAHLLSAEPIDKIEPYFITGNALNAISGRVAFALGVEGPAVAIDTACSSALVAVHQACQALHSGDCDLALAGGVNVLLSPVTVIAASRARMLSPVGRCKTFDASADGYVRSEGCGILVLKRLNDAERDGDRVLAVIAGSAVNQDGASSGLTVPNGGAQQRLIGAALSRAGLAGGDVDYLEAHGTGTPLGDPIEVQAAAAAYGGSRTADRPLLMGSVKTNIGHTESASGAAGLIKVVLSLQHELLPQSLHFDTPSPHIPWDSLPVRVVRESTPWQANGRPRRAGVSSFGFTGTNAHVLIEEAPTRTGSPAEDPAPDAAAVDTGEVNVLALSARSPEALLALAQRYEAWLSAHPDVDLADVCRTAGMGRSHFEHRAALVVDSVEAARAGLAELAENRLRPGVVRGEHTHHPTTAWLFTGQGSQYPGMARELFDTEPVFADTVTRCADAVKDMLPRPLLDVLFATDRRAPEDAQETLRHTSFAQPALFAIEMGLARLWQSWGIEPDVVLGHSVGQYAAACVAGVFSLEDGARLMAERGRMFGSLPEGGRMVAVFTDAKQVEQIAGEFPHVSVGAYNGPNTVLSGPGDDLEQIVATFSDEGVRCTWLETSHAFHSELLDPVLDEFESYAAQFEFATPTLPLVCNRTGAVLTAQTPLDAQYWRRHSRQPVQFAESVRTVAALGCSVVMEIGPQPVLTAAAVQVWPEHLAAPRAIVSLRKGVGDRRQIADAQAAAYIGGHLPDFAALHRQTGRRLELPTYPFQRRRFWPKSSGIAIDGPAVSGILGSAKDLASGDSVYTSRLSVKSQPWLSDHVIYGTVVVPGATYAAMALAAVGTPARAKDVFFYEPIILPEKSSREVQLTLHPQEGGDGWKFQVHSRPYGERGAEWSLNAEGSVIAGADGEPESDDDPVDEALERLNRMRPQELFETFADLELVWGPTWSGSLKSLWLGAGEAIGDIVVGEELSEQLGAEPMHPVLMDLCTGVAFPAFPALLAAEQGVNDLFLPLRYGQVTLREKMPRRFYCRAKWHASALDSETQVFDLEYLDRDGRHLGGIREFTVKRAPREALLRGLGGDATRLLYTLGWHEVPLPASSDDASRVSGTWLIAGFEELAANVAGCISFDRNTDPELLGELLAQAHERGLPFAGVVWRSAAPSGTESSTDGAARVETEIAHLLSAVHTVQHGSQNGSVKLPGGLWITTERGVATESGEPVDPVQAALWGFGRTAINEEPALRCKLVDCDGSEQAVQALAALLATPDSSLEEHELALRQGKLLVSRLLPWSRSGHLTVPRSSDYVLAPTERGAIDNLRLTEAEVPAPDEGYVQVRVEAAGLNFRDVLNVLGLYPGDPGPIGGDFAGTVTQLGSGVTGLEVGQRVYGFMQGAFASRFNVPAQLLAPIPDGVGAVAAATIPAAALTVRLAFDWAQVQPGDRVLIHAASGGVGLAAIQLAQQCGATVFATASTYKRATLRKLGVQYVYDSRTTDFADQILADTDGAGVDVVLNSLTNEGFLEATVRATAQNGRFAEIAKRDIWTPEQMADVRPDIAYEIVALDTVTFQEPERIRGLLTEVSEGLGKGEWAPLPAEIYPLTEARAAFRRMQQARHIGKIVVQMPNPLQPRPDRSYLITGGLGAIGLHTASYLAQLGAGDIVLTSRREPDADAQREIEEIAERFKCRVHVFAADVSDESEVDKLLERIRAELPPLAGVVHLAGVLDDALLSAQTPQRFRTTLAPKAFGACHLDRLTKDDELDFFIVSSSVSSLFGSPGQSNYATANALLDGLVAQRRAQGLPATGVNFGPWAQGGMASSEAAIANITAQGLIPLEPSAALSALAEVVANGTGQATVLKANWQRAAKVLGSSRPPILDLVLPSAVGEVTGDSELLKQLMEIPVPQRAAFVTEFLQREVQHFLRLAQPPAASSRFLDLGTDSLMAIELRNRLHSQFGGKFTINATAVFDYPTIGGLAEYLVAQLPDAESVVVPEAS
ncbi:type I polyketide synthase [Mycobacterium lentiflavum]|uniref:SDR family NAD(P)-dependent oxidoreductase n=1 Tax=Mycobacterium lentiflavum TaxID=141349 RepID=A0ABY3UNC5_MYCLN|nr:type I polyketide synthase [Mycobacterium lentiflavum]ULP40954.1 SDR family NAD(P)-dependent oxidoreductase [Mycobacterium lentiflavum]